MLIKRKVAVTLKEYNTGIKHFMGQDIFILRDILHRFIPGHFFLSLTILKPIAAVLIVICLTLSSFNFFHPRSKGKRTKRT